MIRLVTVFKDGSIETVSTTLDYAIHLAGQLLIDPTVAVVNLIPQS